MQKVCRVFCREIALMVGATFWTLFLKTYWFKVHFFRPPFLSASSGMFAVYYVICFTWFDISIFCTVLYYALCFLLTLFVWRRPIWSRLLCRMQLESLTLHIDNQIQSIPQQIEIWARHSCTVVQLSVDLITLFPFHSPQTCTVVMQCQTGRHRGEHWTTQTVLLVAKCADWARKYCSGRQTERLRKEWRALISGRCVQSEDPKEKRVWVMPIKRTTEAQEG